jgi:hypothetical protein
VKSTVEPSKDWRRPVPGDGQERRLMPQESRIWPRPVIHPANPSRSRVVLEMAALGRSFGEVVAWMGAGERRRGCGGRRMGADEVRAVVGGARKGNRVK